MDTERYELENKISSLEAALRRSTSPSLGKSHGPATTAAEIDNEALREQVAHLQQKIAAGEDALEDARAAAERICGGQSGTKRCRTFTSTRSVSFPSMR